MWQLAGAPRFLARDALKRAGACIERRGRLEQGIIVCRIGQPFRGFADELNTRKVSPAEYARTRCRSRS